MKEIYNEASKVLVWLGTPSETSELALAKMKAMEAWWYIVTHRNGPMSAGPDKDEEESEKDLENSCTDVAPGLRGSKYYEPILLFSEENDQRLIGSLEAIASFLENQWWKRAWIAQEVSSPASNSTPLGNVEIILGRQSQTISFRSTVQLLVFILNLFSSTIGRSEKTTPIVEMLNRADKATIGISRLTSISKIREQCMPISQQVVMAFSRAFGTKQPKPTMEQLLWTLKVRPLLNIFRGLGCENPSDKIYAALPLVLPTNHPAFAPEYGLPTAEVYIPIVESFIKHEKCLSILADHSGTDSKIPSWVPDFGCPLPSHSLCARLDTYCRPIYHASGDRMPEARVKRELFFPGNGLSDTQTQVTESEDHENPHPEAATPVRSVLEVHGVVLDKISTLAPLSNTNTIRRPSWEALLEPLAEHYAPANESTKHSFQRILTGDVERSFYFSGYESFATWTQKFAGFFEAIERDFWDWITQAHESPPSYSILQAFQNVPGPREKHLACLRGAPVDESFFTRPEPPDDPDVSNLSEAETKIVLAERDETRRVKGLIENTTTNRVFCVTKKGYMGLVPYQSKIGDRIVVLFGGYTPFVLREREIDIPAPSQRERRWESIGECYVHGFMDGEALIGLDQEGSEVRSEKFVLV